MIKKEYQFDTITILEPLSFNQPAHILAKIGNQTFELRTSSVCDFMLWHTQDIIIHTKNSIYRGILSNQTQILNQKQLSF